MFSYSPSLRLFFSRNFLAASHDKTYLTTRSFAVLVWVLKVFFFNLGLQNKILAKNKTHRWPKENLTYFSIMKSFDPIKLSFPNSLGDIFFLFQHLFKWSVFQ
jgi:hypothetical protein